MDPLAEYLLRHERWRAELNRNQQSFIRIGNIRLLVALAAAALAWLAFFQHWLSGWWLLVPLAVFIVLIVVHERVARGRESARRGMAYYERGLARLDDRWAGTGNPGDRFAEPDHVYASDLDVLGRGSLFELACVARTAEGEQRLADWLLASAAPGEVRLRQQASVDLRDRVQLREDLAFLGDDVRAGVHAATLAAWGGAPPVHFFAGARWLALAVALYNIAAFSGWMGHAFSGRPFVVGILIAIMYRLAVRVPSRKVHEAAETPAHDLEILALVLRRLETERFDSPRLRQLSAALQIDGSPASRGIATLGRWMELLDSCDHVMVRVVGPLLLWREQVLMAIEAWRRHTGARVPVWLEAVADIEALSSLGSLAFERPQWCFPELADGPALFESTGLLHPLMDPKRCVPNDVRVAADLPLTIVSGSNMSGKSTLMRSIGLNTVLAWAGGPAAAKSLRLSPLAVGATIRTVDSLQDGKSRFYAEITRLRQIVDLTAGDRAVLFLLDELLSGTNSHDRRIGAEAIVRTLVERGAVGLVTTHDLALTRIAATLEGRAVNVHFEDHLEDGHISFDYKMRPGVVERSNALELMRAVGLEV